MNHYDLFFTCYRLSVSVLIHIHQVRTNSNTYRILSYEVMFPFIFKERRLRTAGTYTSYEHFNLILKKKSTSINKPIKLYVIFKLFALPCLNNVYLTRCCCHKLYVMYAFINAQTVKLLTHLRQMCQLLGVR